MASPEDTPMKKQWLEVDGRMTPVILPQIWNHDKEEWEVTSEQNPLPTQVTGSIAENVIERNVYTSNELSEYIEVPYGIKGAQITLSTHGVTGNFEENEGVTLRAFSNNV